MTDGDFEDRVGWPEPEESRDELSTVSAPPAVEMRWPRRHTRICTVLLAVSYEWTRSLVVPYVVHALNNACFVVGTLLWYG